MIKPAWSTRHRPDILPKGGEGTVSGVMIGAEMLIVLTNGVQMMNIGSFYQDIATGLVLLASVLINSVSIGDLMKKRPPAPMESALYSS